jgi:hypothetical protein
VEHAFPQACALAPPDAPHFAGGAPLLGGPKAEPSPDSVFRGRSVVSVALVAPTAKSHARWKGGPLGRNGGRSRARPPHRDEVTAPRTMTPLQCTIRMADGGGSHT